MTAATASTRWQGRWRAIATGLTVAGLAYIAMVWLGIAPDVLPVPDYGPMFDARGYWSAWDGGLYDIPWGEYEAYVYSPVFAQVLWPFTLLPWPVFAGLWTAAAIGCLFWMGVPWMIAFPGVADDILRGNIHVFLAAMVVLGLRHSPAWLVRSLHQGHTRYRLAVVRRTSRVAAAGHWPRRARGDLRGLVRLLVRSLDRVVRASRRERRRDSPDPGHPAAAVGAPANCDCHRRRRRVDAAGMVSAGRRDAWAAERVDQLDRPARSRAGPVAVASRLDRRLTDGQVRRTNAELRLR